MAIINESVIMNGLIREFGKDKKNRGLMAMAAKRAIEKGDDSVYHNAYNSLIKAKANKEEMGDFNNKFEKNENMKRQLKLTESELHDVIEYAVKSLVKEYTDFDKIQLYGRSIDYDDMDDMDGFNEQPVNNIASENKGPIKVTESQLFGIIKESVNRILKESFASNQVGQYQLGRLAQRKKLQNDDEGYRNVVNHAKLQWGADRGVGTNQNAFGNGFHVGKDNVKHGYEMAKRGEL